MNKNQVRAIGFISILIGITLPFLTDNDASNFVTGLLVGFGLVTAITGKIIGIKSVSESN